MIDNEVAILMTIYKEPIKLLNQSIESILNQSFKNFIFFIGIDNPQYKEAIDLAFTYAKSDERIRVLINEKNLGLPKALNKLLEQVPKSVKFIARMDADDISLCNRIEKEISFLEKKNLDISGCSIKTINENGQEIPKTFNRNYENPHDVHKILGLINCVPHPTWVVKKEVYDNLYGYRNIHACEDYDFLLRADNAGYKIAVLKEELLIHRDNNLGISRQNGLTQFLTAYYLSKNKKYLNSISIDDIREYVRKNNTSQQALNFEIGLSLIKKAKLCIKNNFFSGVVLILQACFKSKWAFLLLMRSFMSIVRMM